MQREFCRRLFRAGGDDASTRNTFLDAIADKAIEMVNAGTALVGTAIFGQSSAQFQPFAKWTPADLLSLIDLARTWADEDDVDAALELIGDPVGATYFENGLER